MQSFIKAALLISALAFVLTGCGVIRTAEPVTNTYEFDGDITDIIISTTACDVVLVPSGDGRTTVVCHEADTLLHEVTLEKGVLRIKKKSSRTGISFNNMDLRIEVSFPVKNYNGLTAETNSGGISVDGAFSCRDAELKTTSGGIRFSGKVAGKLYSDSSSGGQHLTGVDCTSVRATSTSGGIHAETVSGKDLRFGDHQRKHPLQRLRRRQHHPQGDQRQYQGFFPHRKEIHRKDRQRQRIGARRYPGKRDLQSNHRQRGRKDNCRKNKQLIHISGEKNHEEEP